MSFKLSIKFAIIFFTILFAQACYGQQTPNKISSISELVSKFIYKNYKPDSALADKFCERGFFIVKFKVDSDTRISSLAFSEKTPKFIKDAFIVCINKLENDLFLITRLKNSGKLFVLPIMYDYQLGCSFNKNPEWSGRDDYYKKYMSAWADMDKLPETLTFMLNFSDERLNAIDGVLLSTITVGKHGY